MRTCGRLLDTDKAKPLMDQYFDRLQQAAVNDEMPSRIRFMLKVETLFQGSLKRKTFHLAILVADFSFCRALKL